MARTVTVRIPEDQYDWISNLPPRYGKDFTAKLITVLYIGVEKLEKEMAILKELETRDGTYSVNKEQFEALTREVKTG